MATAQSGHIIGIAIPYIIDTKTMFKAVEYLKWIGISGPLYTFLYFYIVVDLVLKGSIEKPLSINTFIKYKRTDMTKLIHGAKVWMDMVRQSFKPTSMNHPGI